MRYTHVIVFFGKPKNKNYVCYFVYTCINTIKSIVFDFFEKALYCLAVWHEKQ